MQKLLLGKLLVGAGILFASSTVVRSEKVNVAGAGTVPCTVVINKVLPFPEDDAFTWAQGFMSAVNMLTESGPTPRLVPEEFPASSQMAFLKDYCLKNPKRLYSEGVQELYIKLRGLLR